MTKIPMKFLILAFAFQFQGYSQASESVKISNEVQILSSFDEPADFSSFLFFRGEDTANSYSIIKGKDNSSYMFVFRDRKIAYFKKPAGSPKWEKERLVNIAEGVEETYSENLGSAFVYTYGDNLAYILTNPSQTYGEIRALTIDLTDMTLIKNEVDVVSTYELYKEYAAQNAPPPTPGPRMPTAIPVDRTPKLKGSKAIYYYSHLLRQEDGRIVSKNYVRTNVNGVSSPEKEIEKFTIPDDIAEFYEKDKVKMVYGKDITDDHFAVLTFNRKNEASKDLARYVLLVYRETSSGKVTLEIIERKLSNFSPPLADGTIGPILQPFYNDETSELSIAAAFPPKTHDQVFSVYNVKTKKLVKSKTISNPGRNSFFMTDLINKGGESIALHYGKQSEGVANFSFAKWSGSSEQEFYKITKGPRANFDAYRSPMIFSADQNRIYTYDSSGTICETTLDDGSIQCVTPNLSEASGLHHYSAGDDGSLRLIKDGVVEMMTSTYGRKNKNDDQRYVVIYSFTVDFNE